METEIISDGETSPNCDPGSIPVLSIVVPLYNEEDNIEILVQKVRDALVECSFSYELILVDDGSHDRTWECIEKATLLDTDIKGVSLSRNFGHQNAIFCGLHYARGRAIITMDGDLQHPPDLIPSLYEAWRKGYKIVETKRTDSEKTTKFKSLSSQMFYWIFSKLSGLPLSSGTSDFRLVDANVADVIKKMRDSELFLRGISHWVGFPMTTIPYQAGNRFSGESKFTLKKMIRLSVASVFSFSTIPLKIGISIGLLTSFLAFIEMMYIFVRTFQGKTVEGWASTLTVISFMFGVMFVLLGIIGSYIGNIFEILKNRPRFLANKTAGIDTRQYEL